LAKDNPDLTWIADPQPNEQLTIDITHGDTPMTIALELNIFIHSFIQSGKDRVSLQLEKRT